jgi:LL-diaminopimelate aminotransferase
MEVRRKKPMSIKIEKSERLNNLPPYLFAEIDRVKREAIKAGRNIIDLGVGDPDLPTPQFVIDALCTAANDPPNHRYALDAGMPMLREAIARWYKERFGVRLDPVSEVLPLIGSKEGIAHLPLAFLNTGEHVLVPDPCYPPYKSGTIFAGGRIQLMPLRAENNFLPDLDSVRIDSSRKYRMMFLNYPNNPTAAVAEKRFFQEVVSFAAKHNIIVCHDAAYSEISFDGYRTCSFLETEGAKEVGVEFHSLSKTCNMTGWRVGWVCGNRDIIDGLGKVKSNIDSGIFQAIQIAAVAALRNGREHLDKMVEIYRQRRDALVGGLRNAGWNVPPPKATFYVWVPLLKGYTSQEMVMTLLRKADIVATPGIGFGENGEGYIRMTITASVQKIEEAVLRISKLK